MPQVVAVVAAWRGGRVCRLQAPHQEVLLKSHSTVELAALAAVEETCCWRRHPPLSFQPCAHLETYFLNTNRHEGVHEKADDMMRKERGATFSQQERGSRVFYINWTVP